MWQLNEVKKEREWRQDTSGIYTLLHYTPAGVRVDIMDCNDAPLQSFIGQNPNAVRKAVCDFLVNYNCSMEHISYIGFEICRASVKKNNYIQD